MKRSWIILVGGLLLAVLAYGGVFAWRESQRLTAHQKSAPELAWLKSEFQIPDQEFERIQSLHFAYAAACAERCRQIDAKNAELRGLLATSDTVTPAIEQAIQDAAQLRAGCHADMLRHFYEVRQSMPPEQGKRYFEWVTARTFGSEHQGMMFSSPSADSSVAHEHHAR